MIVVLLVIAEKDAIILFGMPVDHPELGGDVVELVLSKDTKDLQVALGVA